MRELSEPDPEANPFTTGLVQKSLSERRLLHTFPTPTPRNLSKK